MELPDSKTRAGKIPSFDANGNLTVQDPLVTQAQDAALSAQSYAAALSGATTFAYSFPQTKSTLDANSLEEANVPAIVQFVQTAGYTAAGTGGALYKRVVSAPAHGAYVQSGDGAYWELAVTECDPRMVGAVCDGTTDDITPLETARDYCVATGAIFRLPVATIYFGGMLTFSDPIVVRGAGVEKSIFKLDGTGGAVEFASDYVDFDGFSVDGNRDGSAVRTDSSTLQAALGVHGPMTGTPGYISGVRVGHVRVKNTNYQTGFLAVNCQDSVFGFIEVSDSWGQATQWAGIKASRVGMIHTRDTGNLLVLGSRAGQGVAVFAETNALKAPASWYTTGGEQPTTDVDFDIIDCAKTTDSAVYVHDYSSTIGTNEIRFGQVKADRAGKDGFKIISYSSKVTAQSVTCTRIAQQGVTINTTTSQVQIGQAIVRQCGYDAVGDITGTAAPWTTAANGLGQSLQQQPGGCFISGSADKVSIGWLDVDTVARNPDDNTYGYGLYIVDSTKVSVRGRVRNTDRYGLRMSNNAGWQLDLCVVDACRYLSAGVSVDASFIFLDNGTGGYSNNGVITFDAIETTGTAVADQAIRVNGGSNVTLNPRKVDPSHFLHTTFGVVAKIASGLTNFKITRPIDFVRGTKTDTTDGTNGRVTLAHGIYAAPIGIAQAVGTNSNRFQPYSFDATNFTGQLYDASGAAKTSTSVTYSYDLWVQTSNGY